MQYKTYAHSFEPFVCFDLVQSCVCFSVLSIEWLWGEIMQHFIKLCQPWNLLCWFSVYFVVLWSCVWSLFAVWSCVWSLFALQSVWSLFALWSCVWSLLLVDPIGLRLSCTIGYITIQLHCDLVEFYSMRALGHGNAGSVSNVLVSQRHQLNSLGWHGARSWSAWPRSAPVCGPPLKSPEPRRE